jgi:hypothetical protein
MHIGIKTVPAEERRLGPFGSMLRCLIGHGYILVDEPRTASAASFRIVYSAQP